MSIIFPAFKEGKKSVTNLVKTEVKPDVQDEENITAMVESKRRIICEQFLQSLGIELGHITDQLRLERLLRIDQRIQNMSNR